MELSAQSFRDAGWTPEIMYLDSVFLIFASDQGRHARVIRSWSIVADASATFAESRVQVDCDSVAHTTAIQVNVAIA
jgi:hypothetical protein